MNEMQPLNVGDTIVCKGNKWVIGKILSQKVIQGTPKREGHYLVIFEDNTGAVRSYRSNLDGGYISVYRDSSLLNQYTLAFSSVIASIDSIKGVAYNHGKVLQRALIQSTLSGNTKLLLDFGGTDFQETELDKGYNVVPSKIKTLTPLLASLCKALKKDIVNICTLNPNIWEVCIENIHKCKYFTRVSIQQIGRDSDYKVVIY